MKTISIKEYLGDKKLPKLLTVNDMIIYHVNREAEVLLLEEERYPLPEYEIVQEKKDREWKAGWYNFYKSILP